MVTDKGKRKLHISSHIIFSNLTQTWVWVKNWIIPQCAIVMMSCSQISEKKLVWADEFEYSGTPDSTKWSFDLGDGCPDACGWGNNEAEYYTNDLKNVRAENDMLIIEAHKDSLGGKSYTSTRMVSEGEGDWLYGRIEVKAKLPRGKGTWPAIWMLSTDWKYGGWPARGEIDIMEHVGYDPGVIHSTLHYESYNNIKQTQKEGKITITDVQDNFHAYAIEWEKDKVDFYVDKLL